MSDDPTARVLAAIAQLSGEVARISSDMTELRGEVTGLRGEVTGLRGDVAAYRGEVAQIRGEMAELRVAMMDRMDRLQNAFTSMQQDITVNFAASDRVDRMVRNTTDETRALADQVSAMVRQIRVLTVRVDEIDRRGNGHAKPG